jgi:hypothetical protein
MYIVVVVVAVASISTHCSMYLELTMSSTKEMEQLQAKQFSRKALVHQGWRVCVCWAHYPPSTSSWAIRGELRTHQEVDWCCWAVPIANHYFIQICVPVVMHGLLHQLDLCFLLFMLYILLVNRFLVLFFCLNFKN